MAAAGERRWGGELVLKGAASVGLKRGRGEQAGWWSRPLWRSRTDRALPLYGEDDREKMGCGLGQKEGGGTDRRKRPLKKFQEFIISQKIKLRKEKER